MPEENKTNLFGKPAETADSKPAVVEKTVEPAEFEVRYASTQIARLRIGRFQFEHGVLILCNKDDTERFEKLLAAATLRTQQSVRKIDKAAGEEIAKNFLASSRGQMIRGGDTSATTPPAATPGEQDHVA